MKGIQIQRLGFLATAGVFLILLAGLVLQISGRLLYRKAVERFSAEIGSLDIASLETPSPPEAENAACWIMAGAAALVWSEHERELVTDSNRRSLAEYEAQDLERLRAIVERNRRALDIQHEAAHLLAAHYGILYSQKEMAEIPDLLEILHSIRLQALAGRLALLDGDTTLFIRHLETISRVSTSLAGEETLITFLVALAVERTLFRGLSEALEMSSISLEARAAMERSLSTWNPRERFRSIVHWEFVLLSEMARGGGGWRKGERSLWESLGHHLWGSFEAAATLDAAGDLQELSEMPYERARIRSLEILDSSRPFWLVSVHEQMHNHIPSLGKIHLFEMQRLLARTAFDVRRAASGSAAEPTGSPPPKVLVEPGANSEDSLSFSILEDGSVRLACETCPALWVSIFSPERLAIPSVFELTVPPPQELPKSTKEREL